MDILKSPNVKDSRVNPSYLNLQGLKCLALKVSIQRQVILQIVQVRCHFAVKK